MSREDNNLKKYILYTLMLFLCLSSQVAYSQQSTGSVSSFDFNKLGLVFNSTDSSMLAIIRFRVQNGLTINTNDEGDLSSASTEMAVRRLRLRMGGHLYDKRLTYNIQLSFTRGDMDYTDTQFPNIVRDAMVFWNFTPDFQISFGQTKLPGNRQRVISSADLQFMDRSIVNSKFTLDRDFGFQTGYRALVEGMRFNLRGAISTGDGRNQSAIPGAGLAYTGRVEWLPLGDFTAGGDYIEGDLLREKSPKLSIGGSFSVNDHATRTAGELGPRLFSQKSMNIIYLDAMFKYSGIAIYGEFANRKSDDAISNDPADPTNRAKSVYIYTGSGYLMQASYLFPFNLELATRYALVKPEGEITTTSGLKAVDKEANFSGSVGYYFNNHRAKGFFEVMHRTVTNISGVDKKNWMFRFSTELGI